MKNRRKYMAMIMAVIFAISLQVPVMARDSYDAAVQYIPIQPLWQNVSHAAATLTISGTASQCDTAIIGLSGTSRITATMTLERVSGNNVLWYTSWTRTVNSSMLVMNESATVTSNGTYRLRVDATVVRNGVTEYISISG